VLIYFALMFRWQMCLMLFHDMQVPHYKMVELDSQIIKNVLKQVRTYIAIDLLSGGRETRKVEL
jgi:hypothetical protein